MLTWRVSEAAWGSVRSAGWAASARVCHPGTACTACPAHHPWKSCQSQLWKDQAAPLLHARAGRWVVQSRRAVCGHRPAGEGSRRHAREPHRLGGSREWAALASALTAVPLCSAAAQRGGRSRRSGPPRQTLMRPPTAGTDAAPAWRARPAHLLPLQPSFTSSATPLAGPAKVVLLWEHRLTMDPMVMAPSGAWPATKRRNGVGGEWTWEWDGVEAGRLPGGLRRGCFSAAAAWVRKVCGSWAGSTRVKHVPLSHAPANAARRTSLLV